MPDFCIHRSNSSSNRDRKSNSNSKSSSSSSSSSTGSSNNNRNHNNLNSFVTAVSIVNALTDHEAPAFGRARISSSVRPVMSFHTTAMKQQVQQLKLLGLISNCSRSPWQVVLPLWQCKYLGLWQAKDLEPPGLSGCYLGHSRAASEGVCIVTERFRRASKATILACHGSSKTMRE